MQSTRTITIHLILAILSIVFNSENEVSCQDTWFKSIDFDSFPVEQIGNAKEKLSRYTIDSRVVLFNQTSKRIKPKLVPKQVQAEPRKSDDDQYKYSAMCLLKRSPIWKSNPTLHFFPQTLHSPETFVCQNSINLPLNISKTINSDHNYSQTTDEDENYVLDLDLKHDIIDTNLYNKSLDTYVLVHGFLASWDGDTWMCRVKDMILNNTKANVFILDWSGGSKPMLPIDYSQSVSNTGYVGQLMGSFINELLKYSGQADAEKFHLIGHSLGAHICGFAGYTVRSIGKITALDPAGPCFRSTIRGAPPSENVQLSGYINTNPNSDRRRLSPLSAKLVVALHTDTFLFGLNENCGHFDIYVNGGSSQPNCPDKFLPSRLESLLNLDLSDALNTDITCGHSYAHTIIDSFTEQLSNMIPSGANSLLSGLNSNKNNSSELDKALAASDKKCYPMAYECRSWAAFKAGECGFCTNEPDDAGDSDLGCVFVGVTQVDPIPTANEGPNKQQSLGNTQVELGDRDDDELDDDNDDDDDKINGEDYEGQQQQKKETAEDRVKRRVFENVIRGQHFIRLGSESPTCLYQYQIVIAVNSSLSNSKLGVSKQARHSYYLQMPLNDQAMLTDPSNNKNRLQDRLVQISHLNRKDSYAHGRISKDLLSSLKGNFEPSTELSISQYDIDYYSALITFKSVQPNLCKENDILPSKLDDKEEKRFYLCRPIIEPKEVRLWASNGEQLEKVFWVAFNYMSNISHRGRLNLSYLFTRRLNKVENFQQSEINATKPTLGELDHNSSSSRSGSSYFTGRASASLPPPSVIAKSSLVQPIDCLISTLDPTQSGSTANNLKCKASGAELKYSLKMNPVKSRQMTD